MHEVLVNRLGGLSLPRKSVVRLTDRPDMTLDVYHGRNTTTTTPLPLEASHFERAELFGEANRQSQKVLPMIKMAEKYRYIHSP